MLKEERQTFFSWYTYGIEDFKLLAKLAEPSV